MQIVVLRLQSRAKRRRAKGVIEAGQGLSSLPVLLMNILGAPNLDVVYSASDAATMYKRLAVRYLQASGPLSAVFWPRVSPRVSSVQ